MEKDRLLAFSDGVIAIIITIMVLELKAPHGDAIADLAKLLPGFLAYVLSFLYVAIYWNNHHHLMYTATHVTGGTLWANMFLLFWLSLVPFAAAWMGENHFHSLPTAVYAFVMLMNGVAYVLLQSVIIKNEGGKESVLAKAIGTDAKGKLSCLLFGLAIPAAFYAPTLSHFIFLVVALVWFIPDKRIERIVGGT